jgi:hypothetical protein
MDMKTHSIALGILLLALPAALLAPPIAAAQDDPPGRVASLNYSERAISLQPSGTTKSPSSQSGKSSANNRRPGRRPQNRRNAPRRAR